MNDDFDIGPTRHDRCDPVDVVGDLGFEQVGRHQNGDAGVWSVRHWPGV